MKEKMENSDDSLTIIAKAIFQEARLTFFQEITIYYHDTVSRRYSI